MKGKKILEVWPPEQIKQQIEAADSLEKQYIIAGLFGTGARVNEFRCIKKKDISIKDNNGIEIITIILPTFKNKLLNARSIHLFPIKENWFTDIIIKKWNNATSPEEKLFNKSDRWIELKTKQWFGKNPHFFRHCRCTYNYTFWKMQDTENKAFMGWSDTQMATTYTHFKDQDRIESMLRKLI